MINNFFRLYSTCKGSLAFSETNNSRIKTRFIHDIDAPPLGIHHRSKQGSIALSKVEAQKIGHGQDQPV